MEKFFDTVYQSKRIEVLSRTIKDGRGISLIHKYLNAGVIANRMFERTETGMLQGGPLSSILSNIILNELDKELERRWHRFVRYADDCIIFYKSRKSAKRTLENIIPFIEGKLFLKINRKKIEVAHVRKGLGLEHWKAKEFHFYDRLDVANCQTVFGRHMTQMEAAVQEVKMIG